MGDALATVLTERTGLPFAVIQTAMGWVAKPELVAASSNAGAFGFLACAVMSLPRRARKSAGCAI
jgi:NAD(P)H-dependent flavin oxidoreductase YrpB (nitropropane dioxygenase family)